MCMSSVHATVDAVLTVWSERGWRKKYFFDLDWMLQRIHIHCTVDPYFTVVCDCQGSVGTGGVIGRKGWEVEALKGQEKEEIEKKNNFHLYIHVHILIHTCT